MRLSRYRLGSKTDDRQKNKKESTYGVVGMEDVGGRRVIDDDDLVEVTTQSAQVFDVVALVKDARLPEKTAPEGPLLV